MKSKEQKRREAEERAAVYVPRPSQYGLKEKIKAGTLDPMKAHMEVLVSENYSFSFLCWSGTTGVTRYEAAVKAQAKVSQPDADKKGEGNGKGSHRRKDKKTRKARPKRGADRS
jgi:hypothetical protein